MPKFINDIPRNNSFKDEENSFTINKKILEGLINKNEIEKNKIIALSGKWGSGKSTVLKMVNDEDNNIKVVEFDILSYSDDQVRRSFLINLYRKLDINESKSNQFKKNKNTRLEQYIIGNIKEYEVEEYSRFKNITKILILLFLSYISTSSIYRIVNFLGTTLNCFQDEYYQLINGLISFEILLFSISVYIFIESKYNNKKLKIPIIFFIALIVVPLYLFFIIKNNTLIIILMILITSIFIGYIIRNNFEVFKKLWDNIIVYIFPFLNNISNINKTSTEETEYNDITGLEFREYYKEILKLYFDDKTNDNKHLLIAIDNLDRIKTDKIKSIIYNLSLFLSANDEYNNKSHNIYFIALIDKENFFNQANCNDENNTDEEKKHNAQFFEKIFPIRLEISNITNLDWRKFLNDKIKEGFYDIENDIDNDTIKKTIWLYEAFSQSNILPRDIIYFVNKIIYNYKVMQNSTILENNNNNIEEINNRFKASVLNALYSMFIEERKIYDFTNIADFVLEIHKQG